MAYIMRSRYTNEELYLKLGTKVLVAMSCVAAAAVTPYAAFRPLSSLSCGGRHTHHAFSIMAGCFIVLIAYSSLLLCLSSIRRKLCSLSGKDVPRRHCFLNNSDLVKILTDLIGFGMASTFSVLNSHLEWDSINKCGVSFRHDMHKTLKEKPLLHSRSMILFLYGWEMFGMGLSNMRGKWGCTVYDLVLKSMIVISLEYLLVSRDVISGIFPLLVCTIAFVIGVVSKEWMKSVMMSSFPYPFYNTSKPFFAIYHNFLALGLMWLNAEKMLFYQRCRDDDGHMMKTLFLVLLVYCFSIVLLSVVHEKTTFFHKRRWWIDAVLEIYEFGFATTLPVFLDNCRCDGEGKLVLIFDTWRELKEKPLLSPQVIIFMLLWAVVGLCTTRSSPPVGSTTPKTYTHFELSLGLALSISFHYWTAAIYIPFLVSVVVVLLVCFKEFIHDE
ncbi:unnamed protein product, partial [Cuscuta europaea]